MCDLGLLVETLSVDGEMVIMPVGDAEADAALESKWLSMLPTLHGAVRESRTRLERAAESTGSAGRPNPLYVNPASAKREMAGEMTGSARGAWRRRNNFLRFFRFRAQRPSSARSIEME